MSAKIHHAPRWRSALAGLVDAAIVGGVGWTQRTRITEQGPAVKLALALAAPSGELVREQLRSPGQRLFGLKTVDRRSGRRVEPWRSLLLVGARAGGQWLAGRLKPPTPTPEQQRAQRLFGERMRDIYRLHGADPARRGEEIERALAELHPPALHVNVLRALAPTLAFGLLNMRLRRRLAPTVEVLAREL